MRNFDVFFCVLLNVKEENTLYQLIKISQILVCKYVQNVDAYIFAAKFYIFLQLIKKIKQKLRFFLFNLFVRYKNFFDKALFCFLNLSNCQIRQI